ncbi:MAG: nitroreductase [Anaerovoracaceae bacterium]
MNEKKGIEVLKNIETRRSVRKFKETQVPAEAVEQILRAGLFAPSGRSAQSPIMVVVREKETLGRISALNGQVMGSDSDPFYGAPTLVVVFAKKERTTRVEDGSATICNMLNAAHAIGVDSCWIHRAKEVFETEEGKALMEQWGVGEEYMGIGNCILGYCDGDYPVAKPRNEGRIIWDESVKK